MTGLPTFCVDCGTALSRDNPRDHCAECAWYRRDSRLRSIERDHQRQRRRQAIEQRLAALDEKGGDR